MEDIILVTGCDLTRSWTNIAFFKGQGDAQVSFGVRVEGLDISINYQFSRSGVRGAVLRHGPSGKVRCLPLETINESDTAEAQIHVYYCRTCPRINVYSSEDFVLLDPSGYCPGVFVRPQVPPQTQESTTVIQARKLHQFPRLKR